MDDAETLAQELAKGPMSLGIIRELLWSSVDASYEEQLNNERMAQKMAGRTSDFRKALPPLTKNGRHNSKANKRAYPREEKMRRVDWFPIGIAFAVWAAFFAIIFVERWQASQRAGFDEARLARIDAHYQAAFDNGEMPGARAVIYQGGEIVYERNWGFQDIASKTPIKADTIFHIYSMTKPITWCGDDAV